MSTILCVLLQLVPSGIFITKMVGGYNMKFYNFVNDDDDDEGDNTCFFFNFSIKF